jgi:hypothetical protein
MIVIEGRPLVVIDLTGEVGDILVHVPHVTEEYQTLLQITQTPTSGTTYMYLTCLLTPKKVS